MAEFDLHIEYRADCYDGDWLVDCKVTYPVEGQKPITVDYHRVLDDTPEETLDRALKDIRAYMQFPERWIQDYIVQSSEDWRKLKAAQEEVERYQSRIEQAQHDQAFYTERLAGKQREVERLQARIDQSGGE